MKISASKFQFENHIIKTGHHNPFVWVNDRYTLNPQYTAIGYCMTEDLSFRPRVNEWAMMILDDEGIEFWAHTSKHEMNICFPNISVDNTP